MRQLSWTLLVLTACFLLIVLAGVVSVADAQQSGSMSQGGSFAVYITGLPNTGYYVWLTGTFTMSGKPGDQPPFIAGGQASIQEDPVGGPYIIGSYQIYGENGRTILDDVAPSTPNASNTNYYALVTTDLRGQAVVEFRTSINTAKRTYSVKVENPQSVNSNNLLVQEKIITGEILPTISLPTTAIPTPPVTTAPPSSPPTTPVIIPVTSAVPPPTTPARIVPWEIGSGVLAIAASVIMLRRE